MNQTFSSPQVRLSIAEIISAASGHWVDIYNDAGIPTSRLDGSPHPCPLCGGYGRFAAAPDVNESGLFCCDRCFKCDGDDTHLDGIAGLQWIMKTSFDSGFSWLVDRQGPPNPERKLLVSKIVAKLLREQETEVLESMGDNQVIRILSEDFQAAMTDGKWRDFAKFLNQPIDTLKRMFIGWSREHNAITWSLVDEFSRVVEIRLTPLSREEEWSIGSGVNGMLVPTGTTAPIKRLFLAQGPTDTAALLSRGYSVIGRSSDSADTDFECYVVRTLIPSECVIVTARGEAALESAQRRADDLTSYCRNVRILVLPQGFDTASAWLQSGITAADVEEAVSETEARCLHLTS